MLWTFANFLLVVIWLPFVLSRLAPTLSWRWLVFLLDVMLVGLPALPLFAVLLLVESSLKLGRAETAACRWGAPCWSPVPARWQGVGPAG